VTTRGTRRERRKAKRGQRAQPKRASPWHGPLPFFAAAIALAAIIGAFVLVSRNQAPPPATGDDTAYVAATITTVPRATLDAVGAGALQNPLRATGQSEVTKGASGKPVVIYVGGEFCPFCASQRWSLVVALSRFGTFSGLRLTTSSSTDVYPNTPTLTFTGSSYASDVVELAAVETADRERKPIATPSPLQGQSIATYDPDGSIPYLSIGDRYVVVGSGYPPDVLAGKTWRQIADALKDSNSSIARAVLANANYLTAAICDVTAQAPTATCDDPALKALAKPKA
jgi:thiol-disulfide isomerase/thioredoxin